MVSLICSRERLWIIALCALQLLAASPAHACTCIQSTEVLWPVAGTSVSADTAIVINVRPLTVVTRDVTLRTSDGTEIALKQVQKLQPPFSCEGTIVFLRPEPELTPGMEYEVTVQYGPSIPPEVLKFAAREKSARPQAAAKPNVTYLSVAQHPDCEPSECYDLAEVRVELAHALDELTWLQVRSGADRFQINRWEFSKRGGFRYPWTGLENLPENLEREAQISVPVPADDSCVDIAIYGIDGLPVFEERRCEPDRCAVYQQRLQTTCGEPPSSALDATRLSRTSCDDPPVLDKDNWYPELDADTEDAAQAEGKQVRLRTKSAPGCQASPLSAASQAPWLFVLFAAGIRARRRCYAPTPRRPRTARPNA